MGWLTGSRIFKPMLHVQMQVQVLPVAMAITLVCRYVVKYHGEWFDFACVQVIHTWETATWTRSKENFSSDATSVYVCEWNKMLLENMITREFIIEWVINGTTASLSPFNRSGTVAMDRYQWLSNTYGCHYMLTFTASHTRKV